MKPIKFHRKASEEYNEAILEYSSKSPKAGQRFCEEIEKLIEEIARNPATFRRITGPYQRNFGSTFPHAVIYEEKPDCIHIVAIAHMHRRPNYWVDRIISE